MALTSRAMPKWLRQSGRLEVTSASMMVVPAFFSTPPMFVPESARREASSSGEAVTGTRVQMKGVLARGSGCAPQSVATAEASVRLVDESRGTPPSAAQPLPEGNVPSV